MEPDQDEHQHPGEEDLDWDDETVKGNKPKGLYSKTSEKARGFISTETQCALFCGGKKCKYCSSEGWEPHEMAIKGLYCQWVTDNILAMARPSNAAIEKYDLVQQFLDAGINSIINLQIAGEHADCGPHKLDPSGFLYNPQAFMEKGVFFYNFGWPDYGVASLSTVLDMVKVMQFALSQGKVAIHCHAGRGRTGVIIACYLVFTNRITGGEAIHYVREKRPQSIQTRQQMQVIQEFEQYLKPFRIVFASREKGSHEFNLQQYLNRQRHVLHGYEARRLKHVPKIVYTVCERLLELAMKGSSLQRQLDKAEKVELTKSERSLEQTFSSLTTKSVTDKSESPAEASLSKHSIASSSSGKKRRYKRSLAAPRSRQKSISMEDLANDKFMSVLDDPEVQSVTSIGSSFQMKTPDDSDVDEEDDDASIVFGSSTVDLKSAAREKSSGQLSRNRIKVNGEVPVSENTSVRTDLRSERSITVAEMSEDHVQTVAYALSATKVEDYVKERSKALEENLNNSDGAWKQLSTEGDPHVLSFLLWDWLDELKEPVLRVQELKELCQWIDDPSTGLHKVEKGTKHTIEYLVRVISKLKPLKDQTLINLYEKLLSHLTHQWVVIDSTDSVEPSWVETVRDEALPDKEHWDWMRTEVSQSLYHFFQNLQKDIEDTHRNKSKTP